MKQLEERQTKGQCGWGETGEGGRPAGWQGERVEAALRATALTSALGQCLYCMSTT